MNEKKTFAHQIASAGFALDDSRTQSNSYTNAMNWGWLNSLGVNKSQQRRSLFKNIYSSWSYKKEPIPRTPGRPMFAKREFERTVRINGPSFEGFSQ